MPAADVYILNLMVRARRLRSFIPWISTGRLVKMNKVSISTHKRARVEYGSSSFLCNLPSILYRVLQVDTPPFFLA